MDENNVFSLSIVEFSAFIIFILIILLIATLIEYNSLTGSENISISISRLEEFKENENALKDIKEVNIQLNNKIEGLLVAATTNFEKLTETETKLNIIKKENYTLNMKMAELLDVKTVNAELRNEIVQILDDMKILKENTQKDVIIKTKLNDQIKDYEKHYGKLSNIPPDCSKTDLIDNYLFEAFLENIDTIIVDSVPIKINDIEAVYIEDINSAKEYNCIHKIKLHIDSAITADVLLSAEKKLQRYFYVVKVHL